MIQINNVTKSFGGQLLFEEISFNLGKNEKIGLIGRNGSGKSTLFKMILGIEDYEDGSINIPSQYSIAALEQHIHFTKSTVLEECVQVLSVDEQFDHYRAEKILFGLGFNQQDMQRSPLEFSGGYQIRINLTKALLKKPRLLLLDEPTNYLDIVSLRWLKNFLRGFEGELIIITHDREFMDSVVTHVVGIHRHKLKKIGGTTAKFYDQIALEEELYEQTRVNQEKKRKHLQQFVDRFRAKASKATQAQSRLKQLEKMDSFQRLAAGQSMGLSFQFEKCPGKTLMQVNNVSFSYTNVEELLFKNINFTISPTDRIGIIGKNGKGKSTLLNIIAQELIPLSGSISHHPNLKKGHFGQTNIQRLNLENTIVQEISGANPELGNTQIRNICGSMMFEGALADKKISVLSGGERSRVLLGKILAHKTNLLLLDEPTNHLDMESVEILTNELELYEGAVVIVTHNEMILRKLVNKLIIFQKGGAEFFLGSYDEFLEKTGWEEEVSLEKKNKKTKKLSKAQRAQLVRDRSKVTSPLKKEMTYLENFIEKLEEKIAKANEELIKASELGESDKIITLSLEISQNNKLVDETFEKLEQVCAELEKHEKLFAKDLEAD